MEPAPTRAGVRRAGTGLCERCSRRERSRAMRSVEAVGADREPNTRRFLVPRSEARTLPGRCRTTPLAPTRDGEQCSSVRAATGDDHARSAVEHVVGQESVGDPREATGRRSPRARAPAGSGCGLDLDESSAGARWPSAVGAAAVAFRDYPFFVSAWLLLQRPFRWMTPRAARSLARSFHT